MKKIKISVCALGLAFASCGSPNQPVQTSTASDSVLESTPGSTPQMPDSVTVKSGPDQMIPNNTEPLTRTPAATDKNY